MASSHTPNYNLNQWESTDQVLHTEFNDDNTKVDEALKTLDQTLKTQEQNAQNLSQQLQSQAGQIASQAQQLQSQAELIQGLTGQLTGKGNCVIVTGSYVGSGSYGERSPNVLSFSAPPQCIFLVEGYNYLIATKGLTQAVVGTGSSVIYEVNLSWPEHQVQWYSRVGATEQLNEQGKSVYYVALLSST